MTYINEPPPQKSMLGQGGSVVAETDTEQPLEPFEETIDTPYMPGLESMSLTTSPSAVISENFESVISGDILLDVLQHDDPGDILGAI